MFECVATGKNLNYGKKGQRRLISDSYMINAVKKGWVYPYIKYAGKGGGQLRIIDVHDKCRLCGQVKP